MAHAGDILGARGPHRIKKAHAPVASLLRCFRSRTEELPCTCEPRVPRGRRTTPGSDRQFPSAGLRFTIRRRRRQFRFSSVNTAAGRAGVRASRVARRSGSVMIGKSMSASIGRLPSCCQIRSYTCWTSSRVGWGDYSIPMSRRHSRVNSMARWFRSWDVVAPADEPLGGSIASKFRPREGGSCARPSRSRRAHAERVERSLGPYEYPPAGDCRRRDYLLAEVSGRE
jgi:hypothetical protein